MFSGKGVMSNLCSSGQRETESEQTSSGNRRKTGLKVSQTRSTVYPKLVKNNTVLSIIIKTLNYRLLDFILRVFLNKNPYMFAVHFKFHYCQFDL